MLPMILFCTIARGKDYIEMNKQSLWRLEKKEKEKSSDAQEFKEVSRHQDKKLCSSSTFTKTSWDIWPVSSCVNGWTAKTFTEAEESA